MLQRTIAVLCLALAPLAGAQPARGLPDPKAALEGEALLQALRGGGYTLYFRHAARYREGRETPPPDRKLCLSETGTAQAQSIGESMKALAIPVGEVLASPMCRTLEHARIVAGRATLEEAVRDEKAGGAPGFFGRLAQLMAAPPAAGTNRVVSGHFSAWDVLFGPPGLEEGESAVLRADGSRLLVVARLRAEDWKALASPANRPVPAQRSAAPDAQLQLKDERLLDALRAGGYTVYFRHGATDMTQADRPNLNPNDCRTQRNLSEAGRTQARAIGEALRRLKLPIAESIASPYCRTMETARLASGRASAEVAVRGMARPGALPDYSELEKIVATPVKSGELRFIFGHGNGFRAIAGAPHLEEGEAAVVRAVATGGWIVVARLAPQDWGRLAGLLPP